MCAETINETIKVCKYLGERRYSTVVEGDIILPDINPDILSIIKVSGKVFINSLKPENEIVDVSGSVCYNAIYISDDEQNSQKAFSYEIEFKDTIDFPGVNKDSIIKYKYDSGNIEYRVLNNRKISVKTPITFFMKAFNNCDISIVKGITNNDDIEVQKNMISICSPIIVGSTTIEYKENVQLDEKNLPIGEILDSRISITNKEYKLSYNKILAKADAQICIVYASDSDPSNIETFKTVIPLMGIIDIEGIDDKQKIAIDYNLKSFQVKPVYQDMQSNAVCIDMKVDVNSYAYGSEDIELITDLYSPNAILNGNKESNNVIKEIIDHEEIIELSQVLTVPDLGTTKIIDMSGDVIINEKNILNGKIALVGNVNIYVLFSKAGNQLIENKKIELPFQQVIKNDGITQNTDAIVHLDLENLSYDTVDENQLKVNVNMCASIIAENEKVLNSINKLELSDEQVPNMPSLVVYYVKPGDSLWKIAKKFRNKVDFIKEFNELSDDTIYPGQRLLIPKYTKNLVSNRIM